METKDIYKFSYDFLVKKAEGYVTKEQIDAFINERSGMQYDKHL